jgi:NitT/TauT family transport system ATP-binding protein
MNPSDVNSETAAAEIAATAVRPVKLKLTNVSKTYRNGTQVIEALQPVTTSIPESQFVVFFGPSGCGKSTLLNIIAGFEDATGGEITLDGQPIDGPHHDRLMMFQEHGLFPWLNVIDNVMYGLKRQFRFKPKARRERADELFEWCIWRVRESVHQIVSGMKHCRARPAPRARSKILLVDEPFPRSTRGSHQTVRDIQGNIQRTQERRSFS